MTTTTTTLCHPRLPVEASAAAWSAAKYQIYHHTDGRQSLGERAFLDRDDADALLLRATMVVGYAGDAAVAWTIGELGRQAEERTRSTAVARLAESLQHVTGTIRLDSMDLVAAIEKLIARS